MDYEDIYVTPEEYAAAAARGLTKRSLESRLRAGWNKADALTRPIRPQADRTYWREIAEANGIDRATFYRRINRSGWSEERAATEPVQDPLAALLECNQRKRTISDEELAQAAANGLTRAAVHQRIRLGWTKEEAISRPPMSGPERGRLSRGKPDRQYGKWNAMIPDKKRG